MVHWDVEDLVLSNGTDFIMFSIFLLKKRILKNIKLQVCFVSWTDFEAAEFSEISVLGYRKTFWSFMYGFLKLRDFLWASVESVDWTGGSPLSNPFLDIAILSYAPLWVVYLLELLHSVYAIKQHLEQRLSLEDEWGAWWEDMR